MRRASFNNPIRRYSASHYARDPWQANIIEQREIRSLETNVVVDGDSVVVRVRGQYAGPERGRSDDQAEAGRLYSISRVGSALSSRTGSGKAAAKNMDVDQLKRLRDNAAPDTQGKIYTMLEKRTLPEELRRATTKEAVNILKSHPEFTDEQRKEVQSVLRKKAQESNDQGTLSDEEVDMIKEVMPEFNIQPKRPKAPRPKRPIAPSLEGLQ